MKMISARQTLAAIVVLVVCASYCEASIIPPGGFNLRPEPWPDIQVDFVEQDYDSTLDVLTLGGLFSSPNHDAP